MRCCAQIGINPTGKRPGQAARSLTRPRITMAVKKPKLKSRRPPDRPMPVVLTAVAGLINMVVTAVTSGTVVLCLLAAKRLL
jgi:hypothetical protein